jgi:hypothetical protein
MVTPNVQFKLKNAEADEATPIFLRLYYHKRRFTYYLGEKILPDYWNTENQRPIRSNKEYKREKLPKGIIAANKEIEYTMSTYRAHLEKVISHFNYENIIPSPTQLKEELDTILGVIDSPQRAEFLVNYIDDFVKRTNKKPYTIRNYQTTRNHIQEFERVRGKKIKLEEVDLDIYDEFVKFFKEKGSSTNTMGTHIKNLKVFLIDADERGYSVNPDLRKRRFKVMEEQTEAIYLKNSDLNNITELDLVDLPRLDRVRDLFLIGCYTGLRYSDFSQVKKDNIQSVAGGKVLRVKMIKTGGLVVIPLKIEVLNILDKYDWLLPKVPSNQKTNEYLKEIGKKVELTEPVVKHITKGGLRVETTVPKWKMLSTHTARRTFATNAYLADVPTISIMRITGHKTEKSFLSYIRISQEDNAMKLIKHPFFMGQLKIVK